MPDQFKIPGVYHGGKTEPAQIKVFVAASKYGVSAVVIDWEEPAGTDRFQTEVEMVGSSLALDYGLDEPPDSGIWVFEGTLVLEWYQSGDPLEPSEYDCCQHWEGSWRPPTDDELQRLKGVQPRPGLEEERYL